MIRFLQTPGKTKKYVLGGLLVLIIIGMTVYLIPGFGTSDIGNASPGVLAKVGDQELTVAEVQQTARNMGRQQFPRGLPEQFLPFLMQRAADQLIMQKAMISEAHRMGFKVSDEELRAELRQSPILFPNGQFVGEQAYESFISQQYGMSVPAFETLIKQDLLIRKLRAAIEGGVAVSDQEIAEQYQHENLKVKFDYAVLTLDSISKQLKPTEAELKAYFEKNKANYANAIPERRNARYIVIDTAKLQSQVKVTPEELQSYYNQHQDEYRVPDQVMARWIQFRVPAPVDGKVDEKAVAAAKAKADAALKQLQGGANFADLARKISEDDASKGNGGMLGWIQHGQVPEIDSAFFSLKKGETSGVVRSTSGFQIIHLDEKQDAHVKSLEEVRSQIEPILAAQKAAAQVDAVSNRVNSDARTKGLEAAAKASGLEVVSAGPFARGDSVPGVGTAPEFMAAVFSAKENAPPEMVHTATGSVVYQVTGIVPARTPSFEEIKARVEQEYKADQSRQMLAKKTMDLSEKARSEHDLKKAAKELGAEYKSSELVGTNSQVPDIGALANSSAAVVFDMKKGDISGPLDTGRAGVVVALTDRQEPPAEQLAASRDRLRDQLLEQKRNQFLQVFASGLRDRMQKEGKIKINEAEMKKLTSAGETSGM